VNPHDAPSAGELIESVREWLEREVMAATEGRLQYHTRVAINALSIVERELVLAEAHDAAHLDRLQVLGVADDAELAVAIRSGALDDRIDEVRDLVWQSVRDKLAVANPKYLASP
jgi:fructose 1,6-bisphosphatase